MDNVYVVVFPDSSIMLFPRIIEKGAFKKGSTCFRCSAETSIDEVREFVYTLQLDYEHGHFRKKMQRVW